VDEQEDLVLQLEDEVLAPPAEPLDAPALDGVDQLLRRTRQRPPRVEDLDALQDAPLDVGRELTTDRLDLGKLGQRDPPG